MENKPCITCRHHIAPSSSSRFTADDHRCTRKEHRFHAFDPVAGAPVEVRMLQHCHAERSPGFLSSVLYGLAELRRPYCGRLGLWHEPANALTR